MSKTATRDVPLRLYAEGTLRHTVKNVSSVCCVSYMRKRIRQHGRWVARGPHLKTTMNMCAVCERMRLPHRVCDREDCKTYFKSRWE